MQLQRHLTDASYWNSVWSGGPAPATRLRKVSRIPRIVSESPSVAEFWTQLLRPFLPSGPAKVIELGSAPGKNLLQWRERFGYEIYGVDFSEQGIQQQRDLFAHYAIDPSHSICSDFLDSGFLGSYRNAFDVVHSGGVIEHFGRPEDVIAAHLQLLKPGGLLVISIPNLQGMYGRMVPESIRAVHNLDIMRAPQFRQLFQGFDVEPLFCGYQGRINLGVAYVRESFFCRALIWSQMVCNLLLRVMPLPENRVTSPTLLFIGRKVAAGHAMTA